MASRWTLGLMLAALALPGCKRDQSILPAVSTCNRDWVVPVAAPVYADSLPVDAPKLVWSLTLEGAPGDYGSGPVNAGDRLVLSASEHLFFVTKDGLHAEDVAPKLATCQGSLPGPWSPPTVDGEGNVYVLGAGGLCSMTSAGDLRWWASSGCSSIPGGSGELPHAHQCAAAILSSDDKLFAGAFEDEVYALDAENGRLLWSTPIHSNQMGFLSRFYGGGGHRLMLYIADKGGALLDAISGATLGPMNHWCGAYGVGALAWMTRLECGHGERSFDTCRLELVAPVKGQRNAVATLTTPGERLLVYEYGVDAEGHETGSSYLTLYEPDGSVAVGPVATPGLPFAVGADGIIYASMCAGTQPVLMGFTRELRQLWSLGLPGRCARWQAGVVLDADGMMYVTSEGERYETTSLHAIQTVSPGLANSSWPQWRHDNRGTAWLDQPVQDRPAIDAGALDSEARGVDGPL